MKTEGTEAQNVIETVGLVPVEPTVGQQMMIEDGLPPGLILSPEARRETWKGKRVKPTAALADPKPKKDEDPATKALRKEIAAAAEKKAKARAAERKEAREIAAKKKTPPAAPATQETDMATKTLTEKPARKVPAPKTPAPARKQGAGSRKSGSAPTAPAAAKANARTPAGQETATKTLRPGSKMEVMLNMALRPEGATEQAICKKLDWKKCRVTLKRTAEKVGAVLTSSKNVKGETVFFAAYPKK